MKKILQACAVGAILMAPAAAHAKTLRVGSAQAYKSVADAAKYAASGDTVLIDAGVYRQCATWNASNLTIRASGNQRPIFDGVSCGGKGIFVTRGDNITVDRIEFRNARVPDMNGAGIRAEGLNLTVSNSIFRNNQNGILVTPRSASGTLAVSYSYFFDNGAGDGRSHGIYVNQVDTATVTASYFYGTKVGHHLKSRARNTKVLSSRFYDGSYGTASYAIDLSNGGGATLLANTIQKGPKTSNRSTAIAIAFEGEKNPAAPITVQGNRFTNDTGKATVLVTNRTKTPAFVNSNSFSGGPVTELVGPRK